MENDERRRRRERCKIKERTKQEMWKIRWRKGMEIKGRQENREKTSSRKGGLNECEEMKTKWT